MKILVINSGSSSLKCQYFVDHKSIVHVLIERIGENISLATLRCQNHTLTHETSVSNHQEALVLLRKLFQLSNVLEDFTRLDGIGHRVVHGGKYFSTPVRITPETIQTIEQLIPIAPLHNPANIAAIRAFYTAYPDIPQIAVFDTAFHQSIPEHAHLYALPLKLEEDLAIRRYGFHGTSHSFVAKEAAKRLGKPLESLNFITLHLGNGASACAIQNGKSIDTSMGFTPLEGLIMGTRSGDLDPAILPYLERNGYDTESIDKLLNKESGLLGICGTNDMREIIALTMQGNKNASLALQMFTYRIKKYIGAYAVTLGNLDAIVFTGGIGEHAVKVRQMICKDLGMINVMYDDAKNEDIGSNGGSFHHDKSSVALLVVPTDEELEIALQSEEVLASI